LTEHTELRKELGSAKGVDAIMEVAHKMRDLRKDNTPQQKLGWYHRHWKGMDLDPTVNPTFKTLDWDT
jgi:hypothetical protein